MPEPTYTQEVSRVFHMNTQSYRHSSTPSMYRRHEQAKKREYRERIRKIEAASFTPDAFAIKEATAFNEHFTDLLAAKHNAAY